jgi:hypothetical protein
MRELEQMEKHMPEPDDLALSALPNAPVVDDSRRHPFRDLITFLEGRRIRRRVTIVMPRDYPPAPLALGVGR